jgi:hypothetical protein
MELNNFFQSKNFKRIIVAIGILIVILIIFQVGTAVGFRKAGFSYQWGENYQRNFAGPRGGFGGDLSGKDFIGTHGVFGKILKIEGQTLAIDGPNGLEQIILVKEGTIIKRFQDTVKITDLKIGDYIVVIGQPDSQGQIQGELIRIIPPPPHNSTSDRR